MLESSYSQENEASYQQTFPEHFYSGARESSLFVSGKPFINKIIWLCLINLKALGLVFSKYNVKFYVSIFPSRKHHKQVREKT